MPAFKISPCMHTLLALERRHAKFHKAEQQTLPPIDDISVYLKYGRKIEPRRLLLDWLPKLAASAIGPLRSKAVADIKDLLRPIGRFERAGTPRLWQARSRLGGGRDRGSPQQHTPLQQFLQVPATVGDQRHLEMVIHDSVNDPAGFVEV